MEEIKLSAIVVGRNEAKKLENCLKSLVTCDEILYGDLDSSDNSLEIAERFNCRIYNFKTFGPSCEYTQSELIKHVANDWVILIDPDEVVDLILMTEVRKTLNALAADTTIGDVYVPWQFYFGDKKLKGTVWGFNKNKGIIVNKNRFEILPITHYGRRLRSGFKSYVIQPTGNNVLHHYWMDDVSTFISKHKKYLKDEGADRYKIGQRISFAGVIYKSFYQFFYCFFFTRGYKDGFTGLFLSFFWMWYSTSCNLSLYKTQLKNK